MPHPHGPSKNYAAASLAAMGVVFGDIGTSPLYALRECFHGPHAVAVNHDNILGVLSVIVWALILIVSLKYLFLFLRADNKGEGGVLALLALAVPDMQKTNKTVPRMLMLIGIVGASLLFGDGMITPAISVLSAVEGLEVATPVFKPFVIPFAVLLLCLLFIPQRFGTQMIGRFFGPVILLWFVTIGVLGAGGLVTNPEVLHSLNPMYGIQFLASNGFAAFASLGTIFLVLTGCEAMYADMGHFGKKPIRIGWFSVVFPGLLLNYFGQGALLLSEPEAAFNPFFKLAPSFLIVPLVILAAAAAVIASQALVTGTFSLTRQAIQLGYLPRMSIRHTSQEEIGQIYIPTINWALLASTVWLVFMFQSSSNLAAAYGIAVAGTMAISTILLFFVARSKWKWPFSVALIATVVMLCVDFAFLASNALKIQKGGWFPIAMGAVIFVAMTTWRRGRQLLGSRMTEKGLPLEKFIAELKTGKYAEVPGTALFMTSVSKDTPPALLHNMRHNKVVHEQIILMTINTKEQPYVPWDERVEISRIDSRIFRIIVYYGFMDTPNVPAVLTRCMSEELKFKLSDITYFLGRETLLATHRPGMAIWRERLFAIMSRNAERATTYFKIPPNQVLEIGMQVEI